MSRLFKIIATIIILIVLIIIIGVALLISFIDPNRFKPIIVKQVYQQTGRHISIPGKLSWSFFPTISITTGEINLSNTAQFGKTRFMHIDHAKAEVRLFPLISGQVEPKTLVLQGLQLYLVKNKQGQTNWSNWQAPKTTVTATHHKEKANDKATAPATNSKASTSNINLVVPDINIDNANIHYTDQQQQQKVDLNNLSLQVQQASIGQPFPLKAGFSYAIQQPQTKGQLQLNATVTVSKDQKQIDINNIQLEGNIANRKTNFKKQAIHLFANVSLNLQQHTLNIKPFKASIANLTASGYLNATTGASPKLNGAVTVNNFNAQTFLQNIGLPAVKMQGKNALQNIGLNALFNLNGNTAKITLVKAQLDNATATGHIDVTDISKRSGTFLLNIDHLNLDNYMPQTSANKPEQTKPKATPKTNNKGDENPITLPPAIWQLHSKGEINAKNLQVNHMKIDSLEVHVTTDNNSISAAPITATLYQGHMNASAKIEKKNSAPRYQANMDLQQVNIAPLAKDLQNINNLEGKANAEIHVNTQGNTVTDLKKHLNGNGQLTLDHGVVKGVDLDYYYKSGIALISKKSAPSHKNNQTNIGNLKALFNINNGIVNNYQLSFDNKGFAVSGKGEVNLLDNSLDYYLQINDHKDTTIPIRIKGPIASPSVGLDKGAMTTILRHKAEHHIRHEIEKKISHNKAIGDALKHFGF